MKISIIFPNVDMYWLFFLTNTHFKSLTWCDSVILNHITEPGTLLKAFMWKVPLQNKLQPSSSDNSLTCVWKNKNVLGARGKLHRLILEPRKQGSVQDVLYDVSTQIDIMQIEHTNMNCPNYLKMVDANTHTPTHTHTPTNVLKENSGLTEKINNRFNLSDKTQTKVLTDWMWGAFTPL